MGHDDDEPEQNFLESAIPLCWKSFQESLKYFSAFGIAAFVFLCLGGFFIALDLFLVRTNVLIIIGSIFFSIGVLAECVILIAIFCFTVVRATTKLSDRAREVRSKKKKQVREQKEKQHEHEEAIVRDIQQQQEFSESARNVANKVLQELVNVGQIPMEIQQHLSIIIQQQLMKSRIEHLLGDPMNSDHIANRRSLAAAIAQEMKLYLSRTPWNPYSATDCIWESIILWKGNIEKGIRPNLESNENFGAQFLPFPLMNPPMMGPPVGQFQPVPPMNPSMMGPPVGQFQPVPPMNPSMMGGQFQPVPPMNPSMMGPPVGQFQPVPPMNPGVQPPPPMWNPDYQPSPTMNPQMYS